MLSSVLWNQSGRLTPKQAALIPVIADKWGAIARSTASINRTTAVQTVNSAYQLLGYPPPKVVFFDSPYQALTTVLGQQIQALDSQLFDRLESQLQILLRTELESDLLKALISQLVIPLSRQLEAQLGKPIKARWESQLNQLLDRTRLNPLLNWMDSPQLNQQWRDDLEQSWGNQLVHQQEACLSNRLVHTVLHALKQRIQSRTAKKILTHLESLVNNQQASQFVNRLGHLIGRPMFYANSFNPSTWLNLASTVDFAITALHRSCNQQHWQVLQNLIQHCGWILPYERVCVVCDRPLRQEFDQNHLLHAEAQYALLFADGYGLYFHHGVALPKHYGQLYRHQWQSEWILTETNAEVRRTLIQGIGYDRICQELQAEEIDVWEDYTLLRINHMIDEIDGEPTYLLKMTCPSTAFIHALRVPPSMRSAQAAIVWINWGINPQAFSVQT